jgi:hypothetical protein
VDDDISALGIPSGLKQHAIDIAGVESTWGANTKNSKSSASGAFQFINETWNSVASKVEPTLGRKLDRNNLQDNVIAATWLAKYNTDKLKAAGQKITPQNLYVMHAFGETDGLKLLRNPNAIARDLVPAAVVEGHPSFFKGAVTAQDVINKAKTEFNKKRQELPDRRAELIKAIG